MPRCVAHAVLPDPWEINEYGCYNMWTCWMDNVGPRGLRALVEIDVRVFQLMDDIGASGPIFNYSRK